jgi:flavodoxin
MSKAIVVFDSMFGNTEKIAKALALGLEKRGMQVNCVKVDEAVVDKMADYELLALGGPTHMAGMSKPMKRFLEELGNIDIRGIMGFCFDTRNESRFNRFDLNSAAKRIEKKMKRMKVKMIHPRLSAIVEGREGPLEVDAEKEFEWLGEKIAGSIHSG